MNKRQVIILWAVALSLGGAVAAVKLSQDSSTRSTTKRSNHQTLFETFPAADISTVEIQGLTHLVTLTKKDGKWTVGERDNYPANSTYVNDLIRTLGELKVTIGMEAGPSFAPRFGMDPTAAKAEDRGLTATFKDAAGKEVAKVTLGKTISNSSEAPSMMGMGGGAAVGRYVRNHADESGFYATSEMFPAVTDEIKRWLAAGFVSPEKVKSISLTKVGKPETDWTLTRETEEAAFKLEGATDKEVLNATLTAPLQTILAYANFEEIVPAKQVAERTADGKQTATLETFEGFKYVLQITPSKPSTAPAAPVAPGMEPPAKDNFLVTVEVSADLPKERKKADAEKPEDAKTKDAAFADRLKALNEKLTKEKALEGITFELAKSTVEALLKDRTALTTPTPPPAAGTQNPGGFQPNPGAVTPALSIPGEDGQPIEISE